MRRALGLMAAAALALAACGSPSATASSTPTEVPTEPFPAVSISNETTIPIAIAVNGMVLVTVPAGTADGLSQSSPPSRPWTVEARSPTGQVLATMTVSATDQSSTDSGGFARVDLPCGRIDLWTGGQQPLGPAFSPDMSKSCD